MEKWERSSRVFKKKGNAMYKVGELSGNTLYNLGLRKHKIKVKKKGFAFW